MQAQPTQAADGPVATVTIPAQLVPALREAARSLYRTAAETASNYDATDDDRRHLRVMDGLVDDLTPADSLTLPYDDERREALLAMFEDMELYGAEPPTPERVVEIGRRFERLLAVRTQLDAVEAGA